MLRLFLVAVAAGALSAACAARERPTGMAEYAHRAFARCFVSPQGVEVYAQARSDCPEPEAFASDARAVIRRADLDRGAFAGLRVVYVRGEIDCAGVPTLGCSDVNRRVSVVSLDCPWPRRLTRHELGHQAVRARGLPERVQDHRHPWWSRGARL